MIVLLWASLAGGAGGATRYVVDIAVNSKIRAAVPWGVFVVNMTASLLMGFLTGIVGNHTGWSQWQIILGGGFLGGYSTFSTAVVESARLWFQKRKRVSLFYTLGMAFVSLVALSIGLWFGSLF